MAGQGWLVLTRKPPRDEVILQVGDERIVVRMMDIRGNHARIGFKASQNVKILRREVADETEAAERR